ncbi:heptaprenylglyceryl phosphate synthase [Haloarchaeobius amylolyticus]|uniref:heptaprenylglyceryl phosphate synthase n=1 Tax=Haloarchaeobius amylolyticus TaxID=1198296 RepID=UPI00226F812F|nr:heptaprenylglyceryl phosphate synthase [Haloarchaeobius amylolyticus]
MSIDWRDVTHITKVDPAEALPADLDIIGHTDAVMVGGSDGVTQANSLDAIERIRDTHPDLTILQEPYSSSHVSSETVEAADYLSVPAVYNGDRDNFVAKHVEFFTQIGQKPEEMLGTSIPLVGGLIQSKAQDAIEDVAEKVLAEGYVIQNLDSKAATVSGVDTLYSTEEVAGAALATESFYEFPIFYIEYSGTYGGPEDVEAAARYLDETALVYGGGIQSQAQTQKILAAGADAVVVGDCFHDDPDRYLETIP